jgi:septal ring factor EnvC (AmiA/AmiB activator)
MPKLLVVIFSFVLVLSFAFGIKNAYGDELDDLNKQISSLTKALNDSKAATAPLEQQLSGIKSRVAFIENDLVRKETEINKGYKDLEKQTDKLNLAIRNYYIKNH